MHTVYTVQSQDVKRVILHANDTDVIVLCIYYSGTLLADLKEFWIRSKSETYLPIHEIAKAMGPQQCKVLPFIHSLSGRDITSNP